MKAEEASVLAIAGVLVFGLFVGCDTTTDTPDTAGVERVSGWDDVEMADYWLGLALATWDASTPGQQYDICRIMSEKPDEMRDTFEQLIETGRHDTTVPGSGREPREHAYAKAAALLTMYEINCGTGANRV